MYTNTRYAADLCASRGSGQVGEEDPDFAGGRLGAVAAVHQVLGELDRQVAPDGAGGGVLGVGDAHQGAHDLPRVARTLDHHDHGRAAGDEGDEVFVERLALMLLVV